MTRSPLALTAVGATALAAILLVVLVIQVAALRSDVASARSDAATVAAATAELRTAVADQRDAVDRLSQELAALPHTGVVPTDSSSLILERMSAIGDQVASLSQRLDQICQNAPVQLC